MWKWIFVQHCLSSLVCLLHALQRDVTTSTLSVLLSVTVMTVEVGAYLTYMCYRIRKTLKGETFTVFHSIVNDFQQIMALLISNVSLQACYCESFPTNGNFVP